jgi:hypothetical protein
MSCVYVCDICKKEISKNRLKSFHRTEKEYTHYNDVTEIRSEIDICDNCLKKINVRKECK